MIKIVQWVVDPLEPDKPDNKEWLYSIVSMLTNDLHNFKANAVILYDKNDALDWKFFDTKTKRTYLQAMRPIMRRAAGLRLFGVPGIVILIDTPDQPDFDSNVVVTKDGIKIAFGTTPEEVKFDVLVSQVNTNNGSLAVAKGRKLKDDPIKFFREPPRTSLAAFVKDNVPTLHVVRTI